MMQNQRLADFGNSVDQRAHLRDIASLKRQQQFSQNQVASNSFVMNESESNRKKRVHINIKQFNKQKVRNDFHQLFPTSDRFKQSEITPVSGNSANLHSKVTASKKNLMRKVMHETMGGVSSNQNPLLLTMGSSTVGQGQILNIHLRHGGIESTDENSRINAKDSYIEDYGLL